MMNAVSGFSSSCVSSGPDDNEGSGYASHGSFSIDSASCMRSCGSTNGSIGGFKPATCTLLKKPCFCSPRHNRRCKFVSGIEVRPSRALDAF